MSDDGVTLHLTVTEELAKNLVEHWEERAESHRQELRQSGWDRQAEQVRFETPKSPAEAALAILKREVEDE